MGPLEELQYQAHNKYLRKMDQESVCVVWLSGIQLTLVGY